MQGALHKWSPLNELPSTVSTTSLQFEKEAMHECSLLAMSLVSNNHLYCLFHSKPPTQQGQHCLPLPLQPGNPSSSVGGGVREKEEREGGEGGRRRRGGEGGEGRGGGGELSGMRGKGRREGRGGEGREGGEGGEGGEGRGGEGGEGGKGHQHRVSRKCAHSYNVQ